ncbi:hypothetical protein BU26DRAFT_230812 [Trematosphaeria pertusa]|uniref:Uncharacterized protein n=1 Tax=Trematosphaeria pertusa TaxID=390896 RepID=A0A6A6ITT1_9PLEO|nr:uncharacterized protein BU26DRAFT_230812 [Trematosphaeria pertusa]KAF2253854.1 hypothetical protein BU26DRAFT_230812 [Trematosphaeria pertusa]
MEISGPSSGSSELPLIPRDPSGLSQQGSINWDNIVHRSLTFTVGVLNRCANTGVDPYSVVVGQAVAQSFPLARGGRENIHNAIAALRYQNGIANTLWFGFGVRALARTLVLTSEGTSLLALCACLGECFHEDLAPEVMFHIVKAYGAPGELTPSTAQWAAIIKACSGSLATSKFPLLAEGLMRLDPGSGRTTMLNSNFQQWPFVRGCPLPEDLATVIIAVGKVASGQLESIHVAGCAAVGWIGAIAEWLFDLRIAIYTSPDEPSPAYSNCLEGQDVQVYLTFDRDPSTSIPQPRLHLVRKSYFLPNSSSFMVMTHESTEAQKVLFSGRVPWQSCLIDTFGSDFERLRKMPLNFGAALGCASRIFKAIIKAETGIPEKYLEECRGYFDASGGQGFVHNALRWFPELGPLKPAMEKASRMNLEAAKEGYEEKFAAIQRSCNCGVCREWDNFEEGEGFCLVLIMETIIVLCQITAGLTVVEHLHPVRSGLETFYKRQLQVRERDGDEDDEGDGGLQDGLQTMGPIIYVLWTNGFVDLTLEQYPEAYEGRLVAAIKLFTGRDTSTHLTASAVSESGICAYLDILRNFAIDPESTGRIHVIPGMIEHDHKPFPQVQDNEIELMRRTGSIKELCATTAELNEVVLEITETAHSLSVNFMFRGCDDERKDGSKPFLRIGPGDIVSRAHKARGLVRCNAPARACKRKNMGAISCDNAEYPILKLTVDGEVIEVCDAARSGDYLRAVALSIATGKNPTYFCILSDGECIDCCLGKAVNQSIRPALVIANVGRSWQGST